ncbi:uncharacterized protein JCM15063_002406 [Sporobolomyces koalae]|uniref:uncharacterized protein n=1 Tax=Sporobolomyces koalae TaxID=500713 RepID=UPI00316FE9CD
MSDSSEQQPTQISSTLKSAQGQLFQAIGTVSSDPSWKEQGDELVEQAQKESEEARARAKGEATADRTIGKVQSAYGMITGDQEQQTEGNLKAEKGEFKSSLADGKLPLPSAERLQGKLESAVGMVTGDSEKQTQGNLKAEKAEWTKG